MIQAEALTYTHVFSLPNRCQPRNRSGGTFESTQPSQAVYFGLTREPAVLIIGLHGFRGVGILGIVGVLLEATGFRVYKARVQGLVL